MLPILLDVGFLKIYTFGIFLVLAFFWGVFLLWKNVKLTSYKEEKIFDGLFISLIGGLFIARVVYVALNFQDFGFNFLKFILVNGYPGFSLIGALIGGYLTLSIYAYINKLHFLDVADYTVSPLLLALSIGSFGAFFGGNVIGKETDFFLNIAYVGHEGSRHIVPIYESILFLIGFFISYRLLFAVRRDKAHTGSSFYFFIAYFSVVQLLLDNLKEDHLYLASLSFNQLISGALLVFVTVFLATRYRKSIMYFTIKSWRKVRLPKNNSKSSKKHS